MSVNDLLINSIITNHADIQVFLFLISLVLISCVMLIDS